MKYKGRAFEEFKQALLVHGGYATTKDGKVINHVEIADKYGIFNSSNKTIRFSFENFLGNFVWMDDGSPCGVKEE